MRDAGPPGPVHLFVGPTLARAGAADPFLSRVAVRPPARRGDVLAAVADGASTIVLVDGYYYTVPSVTHKELLYALDCGVRVLGAASIGALRACELEPCGMEGIGQVFRWFRNGVLDGDDEVALLHGPPEAGYVPLTVALVEVRHVLARLVRRGSVQPMAADRLVGALKRLPFSERSRDRVRRHATEHLGEAGTDSLMGALGGVGVKERDALAAVERALAPGAPVPAAPRPQEPVTGFLHYFKELSIGPPPDGGGPRARLAQAWALAQVLHPDTPHLVRAIRRRHLLFSAGRHSGLFPEDRAVERTRRSLEELHRVRFGRALLPSLDYVEEARIVETARETCRRLGVGPAVAGLARRLRLSRGAPEEALLHLVEGQPEALPQWWLVRSFSFDPALVPALALVPPAREVHACLKGWSGGASVARESLHRVAADVWGCSVGEVCGAAAARGLYEAPGASDGLRFALEMVAAAERLPTPVNDYPGKRSRLRSTPMDVAALAPPACGAPGA